jgi:phosphatidate cytidylyltransferase
VPKSALAKRVASSVVLVPLVVWLAGWAPVALFGVVVTAMSAAAGWELARMFERAGRPIHRFAPVLVAGVTASFMVTGAPVGAMTAAVILTLAAPVWSGAPPSTDRVTTTLLAVIYVGWLLGHGIALRALPDGGALVLVLLGVTWVGESAAYFVGSSVGRHKLAPVVSPNKTIEGAVAQLIASVDAAVAMAVWILPG